jgi:hypothetical protein
LQPATTEPPSEASVCTVEVEVLDVAAGTGLVPNVGVGSTGGAAATGMRVERGEGSAVGVPTAGVDGEVWTGGRPLFQALAPAAQACRSSAQTPNALRGVPVSPTPPGGSPI